MIDLHFESYALQVGFRFTLGKLHGVVEWRWARPRLKRWKLKRNPYRHGASVWTIYTPVSVGSVQWYLGLP